MSNFKPIDPQGDANKAYWRGLRNSFCYPSLTVEESKNPMKRFIEGFKLLFFTRTKEKSYNYEELANEMFNFRVEYEKKSLSQRDLEGFKEAFRGGVANLKDTGEFFSKPVTDFYDYVVKGKEPKPVEVLEDKYFKKLIQALKGKIEAEERNLPSIKDPVERKARESAIKVLRRQLTD